MTGPVETTPTIGAALRWWARRDPDAVAVRCAGRVLTRRGLDEWSDDLARRWLAQGVQVDDLVAVALPNSCETVVAFAAAWKAGATPQPLSPRMDAADRATVLAAGRPAVVLDRVADVPGPPDGPPATPLPDLAASCWKAPTSSGSTGRPKVVRAAAPARFDPRGSVAPFVPRSAVQLVAGPLTHAAPFVYAARGLMTGHELVVLPRFDAGEWLRTVTQHSVTWGVLVPSMMHAVWRHPDRARTDVSSLTAVLHLGARCAPWLKRAWIDWLGPDRVHELYAGTESQGLAFTDGHDWTARPGTVGRALPGSSFRVVRPDLSECAPGEVGEVLMRRDHPTYSYVGARKSVRDGWDTLGDSGWLDADGYLFIGDRLADLVTVGTSRIAPADVETVLEEHPHVRSAVAVAGPVPGVHAVVDLHGGTPVEGARDALAGWCAERLDPPARPVAWRFVDEPLRDEAGKVQRSRWRPQPSPSGRITCDDHDL
ncbi:acyl-CoA synthetase family protein [Kineococcus endophyticus]